MILILSTDVPDTGALDITVSQFKLVPYLLYKGSTIDIHCSMPSFSLLIKSFHVLRTEYRRARNTRSTHATKRKETYVT